MTELGAKIVADEKRLVDQTRKELSIEVSGKLSFQQFKKVKLLLESQLKEVGSLEERSISQHRFIFAILTQKSREEIKNLGGLFVIGTERHESRRIDNQLRGRAGRQGDVGESRFYISLQDDLMRIFGGAQIESLMNSLGLDDSTPIESAMVSKSIERAQKKVEGFNFDRRKQVVEMDDVMNVHRTVIYKLRDKILNLGFYGINEDWLIEKLQQYGGLEVENDWTRFKIKMDEKDFLLFVSQAMLPIIDINWMNHLVDMDQVRDGIGLKGYAQRDPMVEYKREGHERFEILVRKIYTETVERLRNIKEVEKVRAEEVLPVEKAKYNQDDYSSFNNKEDEEAAAKPKTIVKSEESKIGRNDPCWCGSGKKYKNCHGK
jgi:preprotein translocase subunit SecA